MDRPESVQSELRVGHIGIDRYDPRYFSAIIMSTVLGGMFGARLNRRLREELGYTYGRAAASTRGDRRVSSRRPRRCRPMSPRRPSASWSGCSRPRGPAVRRCRARRGAGLPGRHLPLRFESTGGIAAAIEPIAVYGLAEDFWQTYRDKIEAVTAEAHNAAIELIRTTSSLILAVGDARVIRGDVEALGIAPVEVVPAP